MTQLTSPEFGSARKRENSDLSREFSAYAAISRILNYVSDIDQRESLRSSINNFIEYSKRQMEENPAYDIDQDPKLDSAVSTLPDGIKQLVKVAIKKFLILSALSVGVAVSTNLIQSPVAANQIPSDSAIENAEQIKPRFSHSDSEQYLKLLKNNLIEADKQEQDLLSEYEDKTKSLEASKQIKETSNLKLDQRLEIIMPFIEEAEGLCNSKIQHVDLGGRTYVGITQKTANKLSKEGKINWPVNKDVCTMTSKDVVATYKVLMKELDARYNVANMPMPLFYALADIFINYGMDGVRMFLGEIPKDRGYVCVPGKTDCYPVLPIIVEELNDSKYVESLVNELIARRKDYTEYRVRQAPSQVVFRKGWLNRIGNVDKHAQDLANRYPSEAGAQTNEIATTEKDKGIDLNPENLKNQAQQNNVLIQYKEPEFNTIEIPARFKIKTQTEPGEGAMIFDWVEKGRKVVG